MTPKKISETPEDRIGSWVRGHDEDTPHKLAGVRS